MAEKKVLSFKEKIQKVQMELKAPKNLYNSFGKYHYRNAESICEAFKPYGEKYGLVLTLQDDIIQVGDRVYVKATAQLIDVTSDDMCEVTAYARESDDKKGMDASQLTGATSSYARKYALNGLFLLDDTKDADTDEFQKANKKAVQTITEKGLAEIKALIEKADVNVERLLQKYNYTDLSELTVDQYLALKQNLNAAIAKKGE